MHQLLDEKMGITSTEEVEEQPNEKLRHAFGGITPPSVRRGQLRRLHSRVARAKQRADQEKEHQADVPDDNDASGTEIPGEESLTPARVRMNE